MSAAHSVWLRIAEAHSVVKKDLILTFSVFDESLDLKFLVVILDLSGREWGEGFQREEIGTELAAERERDHPGEGKLGNSSKQRCKLRGF
jgi:hypothetical protein